jgi:hypothetical protein
VIPFKVAVHYLDPVTLHNSCSVSFAIIMVLPDPSMALCVQALCQLKMPAYI